MISNYSLWQILIRWPLEGSPSFWLSWSKDPLRGEAVAPDQEAEFIEGETHYRVFFWGEPIDEIRLRGWAREVRKHVLSGKKGDQN